MFYIDSVIKIQSVYLIKQNWGDNDSVEVPFD